MGRYDQHLPLLKQVHPIEDLTVLTLRKYLPGNIHVSCELEERNPIPCVLVRATSVGKIKKIGNTILHIGDIEFWVYVEGINAKQEAMFLCEAVRVAMQEAAHTPTPILDRVFVHSAKPLEAAHRETDWAPAVGPVQYADLPQGIERGALQLRMAYRYLGL